ncbi:TetR/AcrR family transcriptional regulator [Sphingobacterium siyangense]|uniref:TetR family transcriptional regulator n=1 Tax=Sphingobacterium siyangense TaxID=459529 RepID=A0A562MK75_9SPHI|nr:TetR/AcrR family transcriptional regulator [Sphingobacterium siyangense]TWI20337.1 TetR family transcriptional regulator [Sphingobacterium siyangense]
MDLEEKRKLILNSATRRFSFYGYSKTKLEEIAHDISISKGLLYYYFPDKNSLYLAVIQDLTNTFFTDLEGELKDIPEAQTALKLAIHRKYAFAQKYHKFLQYPPLIKYQGLRKLSYPLWDKSKVRERSLFIKIITDRLGVLSEKNKGILLTFIECIEVLYLSVVVNYVGDIPPDDMAKEFDRVANLQNVLIPVLLKELI